MNLTPQTDKWLWEAGYEYHCFISWPRTLNPDITGCAERLKQSIEQWLALSFSNPRVFLDLTDVIGGDRWETTMLNALCRSMALVAVCAPIYYHPDHKWCGIEWASMDELSRRRFPDAEFHAIIPVIVRNSEILPDPVKKIQYHDMSRLITTGRRYYATNEYRGIINKIGGRIEEIAITLSENCVEADCDSFQFAASSAFSDYHTQQQSMPFRKKKL
ncbi:MAG: toll/interleukin-1 receptor domain-containing protein [Desulfococcaceae bacterium]